MTFSNRRVLAVVCWMMYVRNTWSQAPPPAPALRFTHNVNESDIQLYTKVGVECVASSAPFPIIMFIGKLESPSQNPATTEHWVTSEVIRYSTPLVFTITPQPVTEGDVVCWYKSTRNEQISGFSNPVKLVISSLPPPRVTLSPRLFAVGGNYTANCESTAGPAANFSLSLYYRTLPVTPNSTLIPLGSLNLTGTNNMIFVRQWNAHIAVEYVCTMEMLYNGKALKSQRSNFEAAIPEELPVQLWRNDRGWGCLGNLNIKVRDKWQPVCQKEVATDMYSSAAATAAVACRELGCGNALGWQRVIDNRVGGPSTGGVRCNGNEAKIKDCPMDDLQYCRDHTLLIVCSDALPSPQLTVDARGPVSKLYVTDKQSVDISCYFNSPYLTSHGYVIHPGQTLLYTITQLTGNVLRMLSDILKNVPAVTHNGNVKTDRYQGSNSSTYITIYAPVPEGEYDCVFQYDGTILSHPSNSVFIYIYNPPNPVPIVAGVFTTVVGAAIMIYICVFRATTEETEVLTHPCDPEATNAHTAQPESNVNYLPQQP